MKKKLNSGLDAISQSLFKDTLNLILFIGSVILFTTDCLIWKLKLEKIDLHVITLDGVYPIKYLAIILVINFILTVFSYDKEKEISYLLLSASVFLAILTLILEIFYLIQPYA